MYATHVGVSSGHLHQLGTNQFASTLLGSLLMQLNCQGFLGGVDRSGPLVDCPPIIHWQWLYIAKFSIQLYSHNQFFFDTNQEENLISSPLLMLCDSHAYLWSITITKKPLIC